MHFYCKCGSRISDITDHISYKAHLIADQDWYDFLDAVVDAITSKEPDREKVVDEFYRDKLNDVRRIMYQCPECGRIYIDGEGNRLYFFQPEEPVNTKLLQSSQGENWKGYLKAEWKDEKPEWSRYHGYIWPEINGDYREIGLDDYEEFEKEYYRLFEELKTKDVLRGSTLKRNGKRLHYWNNGKS